MKTLHDIISESLSVALGEPPLRRVVMDATVTWSQTVSGEFDFGPMIAAAFGDYRHFRGVASYTGAGLYEKWPEVSDEWDGGWTVGEVTIQRADGAGAPAEWARVQILDPQGPDNADLFYNVTTGSGGPYTLSLSIPINQPIYAWFPLWRFYQTMPVKYSAVRRRVETITVTLDADVQALQSEPDEAGVEYLSFATNDLSEPIDSTGSAPIIDVRRRQYLPTDRGLESLDYLFAVAATRIMARSRTVQIGAAIRFQTAIALSCRMGATIVDARLPGGTATGKIVGYSFGVDGATGARTGDVTIACAVGRGNAITAGNGTPEWVDTGWVAPGWQTYAGQRRLAMPGGVINYEIPQAEIGDDGIDFMTWRAEDAVTSLTVTNGPSDQADAIKSHGFADLASAARALNEVATKIDLRLRPVTGGPFTTAYDVLASDVMVPKQIDLEAT